MTIPDGFYGAARRLTIADVDRVAAALGVEARAIWAVSQIEAAGRGFLADGRPELLFESHQFHKATAGNWDASHPGISQPTWVHDYGAAGAHQYDRLAEAMALDHTAALNSSSWGMFQIMGFNAVEECGFASVDDFVEAMCESEGRHLDAFAAYCRTDNLVEFLRDHDWLHFALKYNGPAQAKNHYADKLADAYQNGNFPPPDVSPGPSPTPVPPPPIPSPPAISAINLPLGEQCSFPISGENVRGEAMPVPQDALISEDQGTCTVGINEDGDTATVAAVALGMTVVRGPDLAISVNVIPEIARVKADLTKIVYSQFAAALARMPLGAAAAALTLALTTGPADRPIMTFPPLGRAEMPARPSSVFGGATFCFGPGLRVIPIEDCRR